MPANLVVLPSLSFLPTFPSLFCFYLLKPPTCFFFFPCSFSVVCFPFFILLIFFLSHQKELLHVFIFSYNSLFPTTGPGGSTYLIPASPPPHLLCLLLWLRPCGGRALHWGRGPGFYNVPRSHLHYSSRNTFIN